MIEPTTKVFTASGRSELAQEMENANMRPDGGVTVHIENSEISYVQVGKIQTGFLSTLDVAQEALEGVY